MPSPRSPVAGENASDYFHAEQAAELATELEAFEAEMQANLRGWLE